VLAGEDDAWAPLESAQEVFELLPGHKRFRSYRRGRHSVFRDAPEAYEDMRLFLDDIEAGELPA
jgi:pimeloyl-ACP methyl ester carboxylesterase